MDRLRSGIREQDRFRIEEWRVIRPISEGVAKLIQVGDGTNIVRLENLKATNGPDLYVYLSADKTASDFVSLGRLKGNMGNQNYEIPNGTDLTKYNNVLIWCRAFSVLFGSAQLLS
ncbi:MAG: DM13 domain-containing protein [Nitrososphaeraceae archaeon]